MKLFFCFIALQTFAFVSFAQVNIPSTTGYEVRGDAKKLSCNCYMLSDLLTGQAGSVWFNAPINLEYSFEFCFTVNFGNLDERGADGIVFALQQDKDVVGGFGVDMGIGGVKPSVFVEMDTYYNSYRNDPLYDHISIAYNGNTNHEFNGADASNGDGGPLVSSAAAESFVRVLPGEDNVEDGLDHDFRVSWDSNTHTFTVYFDGYERLSYSGDIVQNVFGGQPEVYWGFTGGTGSLYNYQTFCIDLESDFIPINTRKDALRYCVEDSIHFTSSHNACLSDVEWRRWDFGDGTTNLYDTVSAITHKYISAGSYQVDLEVVDMDGCTQKDSVSLIIEDCTPVVDFIADTLSVCVSDTVVFSELCLNLLNDTGYVWNFGEGASPESVKGKGPHKVYYASGGEKKVSLSVIDELGRDFMVFKERYITVNDFPSVNIGADTTLCYSDSITIDAGNGFDSYLWNTGASVGSITVSEGGGYYVTVTENGCSSVDSLKVTIADLFAVHLPEDTVLCHGDSVLLSVTEGESFLWGNGQTAQSIWVSEEGEYVVEAFKGSCASLDTFKLQVITVPDVFLGEDLETCDSITLRAKVPLDNYTWSTGENTSSIWLDKPGEIWLKTTNGACEKADTISVSIDAPFVFDLGKDTVICEGNLIRLDAPESDSCLWNDGSTVDYLTIDKSGVYSAVAHRGACVAADSLYLEVEPLREVELLIEPKTVCEASPVVFRIADSLNGGGSPIFEWKVNDKTVSSYSSYNVDGLPDGAVVTLSLTSDVRCPDKNQVSDTAVVKAAPAVSFEYLKDVCVSDSSFVVLIEGDTECLSDIQPQSVFERDGNRFIMPLEKDLRGEHHFSFMFENEFNCALDTTLVARVHDIAPPEATDLLVDVVGYEPYKTFEAVGEGKLIWYDSIFVMLAEGVQEFQPNESCASSECQFTYYVNQLDKRFGCISDYTAVRYVLRQCNVPIPHVFDTAVCDYETDLFLRADTSEALLPGGKGASSLFWYEDPNDDYGSYIHSGFIFPVPQTNSNPPVQTFYVRQFNESQQCYSPAAPVDFRLQHVAPPVLNHDTVEVCDGDSYVFVATGSNIRWYADSDSTKLPICEESNFIPDASLVTGVPTDYYVSQTVHECQSRLVKVKLYVYPKPVVEPVNDSHACEGSEHMLEYSASYDSLFWYNSRHELISEDRLLVLEESQLEPDKDVPFSLILKNNYGCFSEAHTVYYTLYPKPEKPDFGDLPQVFCLGGEPIVLRNANNDETVWLEKGTAVETGISFVLPAHNQEAYLYEAYSVDKACTSDTVLIHIPVEKTPKPKISGKTTLCVDTEDGVFHAIRSDVENELTWSSSSGYRFQYADDSAMVRFSSSGIDTVSVVERSPNGCSDTANIVVAIAEPPVADFSFVSGNQGGEFVFFDNSYQNAILDGNAVINLNYALLWDFGRSEDDTLAEYHSEAISYRMGAYYPKQFVRNEYGCADSLWKVIYIKTPMQLFVPNAFAPEHEADEVSKFLPKGMSLETYSLSIYDNWGNLVFFSDELDEDGSPSEAWYGDYKGELLPSDVYIWKIYAKFENGQLWDGLKDEKGRYNTFGTVVLVR